MLLGWPARKWAAPRVRSLEADVAAYRLIAQQALTPFTI